MRSYAIPADVLEGVAAYLSTRPYREVAGLIERLSRLEPLDKPADMPAHPPFPDVIPDHVEGRR